MFSTTNRNKIIVLLLMLILVFNLQCINGFAFDFSPAEKPYLI